METLKNSGNTSQSFEAVFNAQYPNYANDRLWKALLPSYITFDTGDLDKLSSLLYNENTYGAYSFTAIDTEMKHYEDLAAAVNDKLFFAGEHTEVDYFSTVYGAYLSGIREADKIIDLQ